MSNTNGHAEGASPVDVTWAANWYLTRRHIDVGGHALCSIFTQTWPDGWQSGTSSHQVPPSDSPDVMALKPCGLCKRKQRAMTAKGEEQR
jgi:hypothetical protein